MATERDGVIIVAAVVNLLLCLFTSKLRNFGEHFITLYHVTNYLLRFPSTSIPNYLFTYALRSSIPCSYPLTCLPTYSYHISMNISRESTRPTLSERICPMPSYRIDNTYVVLPAATKALLPFKRTELTSLLLRDLVGHDINSAK